MRVDPRRLLLCAALLLPGTACAAPLLPGVDLSRVPDMIDDPLGANPDFLQDSPYGCHGTFEAAQALSLAEAVDRTLCANPQVRFAWADIKTQAAAVGEARAAYLPNLSLTVNRLFSSTAYPGSDIGTSHNQGTTKYANIAWRLFNFGSREANLTSAHQLLNAAIASHNATVQKLLASLIGAYFDAAMAEAAFQSRSQAAQLAQNTYQATRRREAAGAAGLSDVLQAQTALAKAQLAQDRARGDLHKAQAVLVQLMGLAPNTRLHLPDMPSQPAEEQLKGLNDWLSLAQSQHPSIIAARAQLEAARAKVDALRGEGIASLDLTYSYYQNGYPNQGLSSVKSNVTTYGLALTIPLFEGFGRTYKIRGAQAQSEQSAVRLEDAIQQVAMEVVKAHADARAALENLSASQSLIRAAEQSVQASERRYRKGAADILELLTTQNTLADAQQERIRCLAEWQAARLKLLTSAGQLERIPGREQPLPSLQP